MAFVLDQSQTDPSHHSSPSTRSPREGLPPPPLPCGWKRLQAHLELTEACNVSAIAWVGVCLQGQTLVVGCLIKYWHRAGEMAQRPRALAVLPEVLSSIPNNHIMALNHLLYHGMHAGIHTEHSYVLAWPYACWLFYHSPSDQGSRAVRENATPLIRE